MKPWQFVLNVVAMLVALVALAPLIVYWKLTKKLEG